MGQPTRGAGRRAGGRCRRDAAPGSAGAGKVEAARRAMLLYPQQMSWNWWDDVTVELRFWLPAGSFATSVVRELINTTGDYANIAE